MDGSVFFKWWTRIGRIRTEAEIDFEVALIEDIEAPIYQQVAENAYNLRMSGLSVNKIAKELKIDNKTVAKAIRWHESRLND